MEVTMRAPVGFIAVLMLTLVGVRPLRAGAAFGDPGEGFVPPDKNIAGCENTVVRLLARNAACLDRCTFGAARVAWHRGKPFDDERCEAKCGAALVRAADALFGKGTCPSCITVISPTEVAMLTEQASNIGTGLIACAGTIPLGGDDGGFVPPDRATGRCELAVGHAVSRFDQGFLDCLLEAATRAFRGEPFDEATCMSATEQAYDRATGKLTGCPPCLGPNATVLRGQIRANFDVLRRLVYCASVSGAFLDSPD